MTTTTWIGALLAAALAAGVGGCAGDDPPAITTRQVRHFAVQLEPTGDDLAAAAPGYVMGLADALELGLSAADQLTVRSVSPVRTSGLRITRLQHTHHGVPVRGSELVVQADPHVFLAVHGQVTGGLDGLDVTPAIDGDDALAAAARDLGAQVAREHEATELVIQPRDGGAVLAWKVTFFTRAPLADWLYLIDATDGRVLEKHDVLARLEGDVRLGSGLGVASNRPRRWEEQLEVSEGSSSLFKMETDRLRTVDYLEGTDRPIQGPLEALPDPAANSAHGYAQITLDMMSEWMGVDSIDGAGARITSVVHDPIGAGAFYVRGVVSYGDGGVNDYGELVMPLSGGLDVVAHEISHGFTELHSGLQNYRESGGLNESFSDIAGVVVEAYEEREAFDFLIGEDVSSNYRNGLRDVCNPRFMGQPIDEGGRETVDDEDFVHTSGLGNQAFCLAVGRHRAETGASKIESVKQMGRVWYTANSDFWTSSTSYVQGCEGTVDAAQALAMPREVTQGIVQSWNDVGAVCDAGPELCDGDATCDLTSGETCVSCPGECGACSNNCGPWYHELCSFLGVDCPSCDKPVLCGDYTCDEGETLNNCPSDCHTPEPSCGDGACRGDETDVTCPEDCGCASYDGFYCGTQDPTASGCQCDEFCTVTGDCCADHATACP